MGKKAEQRRAYEEKRREVKAAKSLFSAVHGRTTPVNNVGRSPINSPQPSPKPVFQPITEMPEEFEARLEIVLGEEIFIIETGSKSGEEKKEMALKILND